MTSWMSNPNSVDPRRYDDDDWDADRENRREVADAVRTIAWFSSCATTTDPLPDWTDAAVDHAATLGFVDARISKVYRACVEEVRVKSDPWPEMKGLNLSDLAGWGNKRAQAALRYRAGDDAGDERDLADALGFAIGDLRDQIRAEAEAHALASQPRSESEREPQRVRVPPLPEWARLADERAAREAAQG